MKGPYWLIFWLGWAAYFVVAALGGHTLINTILVLFCGYQAGRCDR